MPNVRQMIHLFASRKIKPIEMGLTRLVEQIRSGAPVSFARYGDGEWSAILGRDGENCDGHKYSVELQKGLRESILDNPAYSIGMQPVALKTMGRDVIRFISENKLDYHWWNADLFHDANLNGTLFPFIELLQNSRTVIIGPEYLSELMLFSSISHIKIPQKNCFDSYESIYSDIETIAVRESAGCIFLFSASMASNVLIHNLFKKFGTKHSFLDVGSLWDIYVGKMTRGVYHEHEWTDLIRRNSGETNGKSLLFYNLFPKTTWKIITKKILKTVPHDEIIVHITLPKTRFFLLPLIKKWLTSNFPKIQQIIWSFNARGVGETHGFNLLRKKVDLSPYSILTYSHSKGSSRIRKNTQPIQDWTELMRYFVIERLDLAKEAFAQEVWFCGVNLSTNMHPNEQARIQYPDTKFIFEGNFVSVNLDKTREIIEKTEPVIDYYGVERYWGMLSTIERCKSLYNSLVDHYSERLLPEQYISNYIKNEKL